MDLNPLKDDPYIIKGSIIYLFMILSAIYWFFTKKCSNYYFSWFIFFKYYCFYGSNITVLSWFILLSDLSGNFN